jgi:hypothetical protein
MHRFTHQDYSDLVKWLEIKATDGRIDMRPGAIAELATKHFGRPVTANQVSDATSKNNITIITNQVRDPDHPKQVLRTRGTQHDRLCNLERRLNYLFDSLGVVEEDCP